jgi:TonB-dependent SusC/RagA subfamily outer membrane receptor
MKYFLCTLLVTAVLSSPAFSQASPEYRASSPGVVSGRVTDALGQPVAAVLIRIESLQVGAATSADGTYQLVIPGERIRPGEPVQITASRVGLSPASRSIRILPGSQLIQNFQLASPIILLEDVVVTGTAGAVMAGRTSLDRVSGSDEETLPVSIAIQGKVAGATIVSGAGRVSSAPRIRLRGPSSISDSALAAGPLYVIDGVVGGSTAINAIDPADIEAIEVLKGPAASTVYGARAAYGVVEIRTTRAANARYVIGSRRGPLRWAPDFTWSPPQWTARHDLPAGLLEGEDRTLGGVFGRLRDALVRAGYDEWGVYELDGDGFVVLARREVIDDRGEPIPPRWRSDEEMSWGEYFRALLFAEPGRYRVIAIVVSPRTFRPRGEVRERVLTQFVVDGSRMLPPEYASIPLAPGTRYTALIYEFFRPTKDTPTRLVTQSRITSVQHLTYARRWTRQQLLGGR